MKRLLSFVLYIMTIWEHIIVILIAGILAGILTPVVMRLIKKGRKIKGEES